MVQETGVQSQVDSYQRDKKFVFDVYYWTLSIIRYGAKMGGAIRGKNSGLPYTFFVVAIEKGAFSPR